MSPRSNILHWPELTADVFDHALSAQSEMTRLEAACGLAVLAREVCDEVFLADCQLQQLGQGIDPVDRQRWIDGDDGLSNLVDDRRRTAGRADLEPQRSGISKLRRCRIAVDQYL